MSRTFGRYPGGVRRQRQRRARARHGRLPRAPRRRPSGQLHEARAVLGMTVDYYRQFAAFGDRLALAPMSERALGAVLVELYPPDTTLGGRALANRRRARQAG